MARLNGGGTAGSDLQAKSTAAAITEVISVNTGSVGDIFRNDNITVANAVIAASGILRISSTSNGGNFPGALVWVLCVRRA